MAKSSKKGAARGSKHRCTSCDGMFYDLDRKEFPCPYCGTLFQPGASPPAAAAPAKKTWKRPATETAPEAGTVAGEEVPGDEELPVLIEVEEDNQVTDDQEELIVETEPDDGDVSAILPVEKDKETDEEP